MQTQVLKTADGFKTEVTLRSIVRAPFYKHGKEDGNILKYLGRNRGRKLFRLLHRPERRRRDTGAYFVGGKRRQSCF